MDGCTDTKIDRWIDMFRNMFQNMSGNHQNVGPGNLFPRGTLYDFLTIVKYIHRLWYSHKNTCKSKDRRGAATFWICIIMCISVTKDASVQIAITFHVPSDCVRWSLPIPLTILRICEAQHSFYSQCTLLWRWANVSNVDHDVCTMDRISA